MEIASAVSAISSMLTIAKTALEARDAAKAQAAIAGMNDKLLSISVFALEREQLLQSMQATNASLKRDLTNAKTQIEENSRYQLMPLGANGHAYVLLDPTTMSPGNPPTYFCQHCKDKGIKSILRDTLGSEWEGPHWMCVEESKHVIYK